MLSDLRTIGETQWCGQFSSWCEMTLCVYVRWLIGPVVVLQLRIILRVRVFHSDASWQDGSYVISNWLSLSLLLLLFLHLLQLDACEKIMNNINDLAVQPPKGQISMHKSLPIRMAARRSLRASLTTVGSAGVEDDILRVVRWEAPAGRGGGGGPGGGGAAWAPDRVGGGGA